MELSIPNVYIEGRVKSVYGIYRKMFIQGKTFEEIYDVFAVRIIVDTIEDCYNVLGIVHDMFQPLPNRFKDYISMPKPNMYQSLHTTVINKAGVPFEVQIRTWEMHHTAESGIAAHWKYKLGMSAKEADNNMLDDRLAWIRQMLENQAESEDVTDLVHSIKSDLIPEEVFVFTPKGDVINLPMGFHCDRFCLCDTQCGGQSDDRRKSRQTYRSAGLQGEDWGNYRNSHHQGRLEKGRIGIGLHWCVPVKRAIKYAPGLKKKKRDENIVEGKAELEREFRRSNIVLSPELMDYMLESVENGTTAAQRRILRSHRIRRNPTLEGPSKSEGGISPPC